MGTGFNPAPTIQYSLGAKIVNMQLTCVKDSTGELEALGEDPVNTYKFRFSHNCVCWDACKGLLSFLWDHSEDYSVFMLNRYETLGWRWREFDRCRFDLHHHSCRPSGRLSCGIRCLLWSSSSKARCRLDCSSHLLDCSAGLCQRRSALSLPSCHWQRLGSIPICLNETFLCDWIESFRINFFSFSCAVVSIVSTTSVLFRSPLSLDKRRILRQRRRRILLNSPSSLQLCFDQRRCLIPRWVLMKSFVSRPGQVVAIKSIEPFSMPRASSRGSIWRIVHFPVSENLWKFFKTSNPWWVSHAKVNRSLTSIDRHSSWTVRRNASWSIRRLL